jgi:hypothetical protein
MAIAVLVGVLAALSIQTCLSLCSGFLATRSIMPEM